MADKILKKFFTGTISKVSSTQRVQTLLGITLSLRVFEINDIFKFHQNLRWWPKFRKFNIFQRHYIVTSLVPTGFKICLWWENDFGEKSPVDAYVFFFIFTQKFKMSHRSRDKCVLTFYAEIHLKAIFVKCCQYTLQIPCGLKITSKLLYLARFQHNCVFCILRRNSRWPPKMVGKRFLGKVPSTLCIYPASQKFHRNRSILHR